MGVPLRGLAPVQEEEHIDFDAGDGEQAPGQPPPPPVPAAPHDNAAPPAAGPQEAGQDGIAAHIEPAAIPPAPPAAQPALPAPAAPS